MTYTPLWKPLADVLRHVCATGIGEDDAKKEIAHAIAAREVALRIQVAKPEVGPARKILGSRNIRIPERLCAEDFDWARSRPVAPWSTEPEATQVEGTMLGWKPRRIALIEIATTDVIRVWSRGAPMPDAVTLDTTATMKTPESGKLAVGHRRTAAGLQISAESEAPTGAAETGGYSSSTRRRTPNEPPPWNLWQFARTVCPLLCRAVQGFRSPDPPIGAAGYRRAEARAQLRYPNVQRSELPSLLQEEIARRKGEMRAFAMHLVAVEIPYRLRRRLAAGAYQVTFYGAAGERSTLPQDVLGGLQPDLDTSSLKGDGAEFLGVRVTPVQMVTSPEPTPSAETRSESEKPATPANRIARPRKRRRSPREQLTAALIQIHQGGINIIDKNRDELHTLVLEKVGIAKNGRGNSRATFERALAAAIYQIDDH